MRAEPSIYEVLNMNLQEIDPLRRFGKTGRPIQATEVYRRIVSTLMRDGIRVEKWIIVNEIEHTVTFAVTYNGITGSHYDAERNTQWLVWETLRSRLETYHYVPTDECPIAEPARRPAASHSARMIA